MLALTLETLLNTGSFRVVELFERFDLNPIINGRVVDSEIHTL
jgi:hypothetical protein